MLRFVSKIMFCRGIRSFFIVGLAVWLALASAPSIARAADKDKKKDATDKKKDKPDEDGKLKKVKGTISEIEGSTIKVKTEDYGTLELLISEKTDIHARGAFGVKELQPGMYLSFSGTVKENEVEENVEKATLFTLADGFKPGIVKIAEGQPQSVLGKVTHVDGNKVTLDAGRAVKVTFNSKAVISVDTKDFRVAGEGNKVLFSGKKKDKTVTASSVVITVGSKAPKPPSKNKV